VYQLHIFQYILYVCLSLSILLQADVLTPALNLVEFDFAVVNERNVRTEDKWAVQLLGKVFHFKPMEL